MLAVQRLRPSAPLQLLHLQQLALTPFYKVMLLLYNCSSAPEGRGADGVDAMA
jgi:hypothetical protein